jgi:predicted RNA-binding protein YlxR (DUF448 family)
VSGKTAHTPIRSCKSCRKKLAKNELQRWVMENNQPVLDEKQNMLARATYVCSEDCYNNIKAELPKIITRRRA